jgi:hypothetical protein
MLTEKDVYMTYRRVQGKAFNGRPRRAPKDWDNHFNNKMKPHDRESIRKMTRYLATAWSEIDLEKYFECGFELWKNFSYHQWFATQVINLYIQKSKNHKRVEVDIKRSLVDSGKFVKTYCKENEIDSLKAYASKRDGFHLLCVEHYLKDKISKWFLCFLIHKKYCVMMRENWERVHEIDEKYSELIRELRSLGSFIPKLQECF